MFIDNHLEWLLALKEIKPTLPQSKWFKLEYIDVYLRMGKRVVDGQYMEAVTIANIECVAPGQGHFRAFITELETFCKSNLPDHIILAENVVAPNLYTMLLKHHYLS